MGLWSALLLGIPVYVFASGLPQPADMGLVMFLGVFLVVGLNRVQPGERMAARQLVQYTSWVIVVNASWIVIAGYNRAFFFSSAFAIFNAIVFVGFIAFASMDPRQVLAATGRACALALTGLGILALFRPDMTNGSRLVLLFNNPNQLAYYALGALTVVYLVGRVNEIPRWLWVTATLAAGFVIVHTYSRSALAGYAILCAAPYVQKPVYVLVACVPLVLIASLAEEAVTEDPLWQRRVQQASTQELGDYMEDRGVDRLIEHPEHLLVGAGEGMYKRFHPFGLELHSSIASILFCYGSVGLLLIGRLAVAIARRLPLSVAMYLAPSLVYSLSHNGMRFRIFWLSVAVAAVLPRLLDEVEDSALEGEEKVRPPSLLAARPG